MRASVSVQSPSASKIGFASGASTVAVAPVSESWMRTPKLSLRQTNWRTLMVIDAVPRLADALGRSPRNPIKLQTAGLETIRSFDARGVAGSLRADTGRLALLPNDG